MFKFMVGALLGAIAGVVGGLVAGCNLATKPDDKVGPCVCTWLDKSVNYLKGLYQEVYDKFYTGKETSQDN